MEICMITPDRIETTAPELLDAQYFLVRQAFRHIDTPDKRHALRKAMKKLRYGVEFLGALYEGKAVRAFLDHCKDTQEVLGKMNDAITMIRLLTELQQDAEIDATQSVFAIPMEWAKHHQDKAEAQVAATYADFKAAKPFWD
jgi:CHAD domain-containing protein